ncbi:hypothetical protein KAU39_02955 [bacterium]|nr:hypothetical protein [bacterium]
MNGINIKVVESKKDLKKFLKFPWKIYRDNSYWVPPLMKEVKNLLDPEKHPFWIHAKRELFLAERNGEVVGRIAAIFDQNHNNFHQEKTGFFGFFECIEEYSVTEVLLNTAKRWCQMEGMKILRGPVNPSMNEECAFLLEGFDKSPTIMMSYTQPYYLEFMERYGFRKAKDLYALLKKIEDGIPKRIEKLVERIKKKTRVKVRPFDMKNYKRDIQFIKDIYNSAWEKNWGFVPMTEGEMDLTAENIKQIAIPELVLFAEIEGKPVGVSVTVPDFNQVLNKLNGKLGLIGIVKFLYYKRKIDGVRSILGGVKKEYRNSGIIAVLSYETEKNIIKLGYKWCELGWNLEDNDLINQFDMAIGGKICKKYRIYEMEI